ncbi:amino acid ABC transporter permease [Muricoccus aerilatus]|uniref:amino acid ABC transporter permease n=1 Tax=Muricoccus aerilatus TaxID=452982 RepID=UPI0005C16A5F|nr:ABC transporter permease subunit [Roseomonas aerilata]
MERLIEHYFNAGVMAGALPEVLRGFGITVLVSLCIIAFGLLVGLALALLRCAPIRPLRWAVAAYVDVFRTLPQLVIIIVLYFALPYLDVSLSPFATTVLALGCVLSAFAADIFFAAIMAVPRGQWDAARALGLRTERIFPLVVLPQAISLAVPLLANRAIAIAKGTALGSAVALPEALSSAQSVTAITANPSPLTLAAAFYLAFFIPLVILSRWLERRAVRQG